MRKVSIAQICTFVFLSLLIVGGGIGLTCAVAGHVPPSDFGGLILLGTAIALV